MNKRKKIRGELIDKRLTNEEYRKLRGTDKPPKTNNRTSRKQKVKWGQSKAERQKWWNGLDAEEQMSFIKRKQREKAKQRRQRDIELMKVLGLKYDCNDCFHRKTSSCKDYMPNGCPYFFRPD